MEIFKDHMVWTLSDEQEIILSAWLSTDDIHPLDISDFKLKIQMEVKFRLVTISFYFMHVSGHWGIY